MIRIVEQIKSRRVTRNAEGSTIVRNFRVHGTQDPEWLIAFGWTIGLPGHNQEHPWIPFMFVDRLEIEPDTQGIGACDVAIVYKEFPLGFNPYSENWQWDLVSGQTKIYAVWHPDYVISYPEAQDTGTSIGFDGEKAQGVNVFRPEGALVVTKVIPSITTNQRIFLERMQNTVNDSKWFDYQYGEVLYTGSRIRRRPDGFIQVDLSFLISRTKVGAYVSLYNGDTILVTPRPWDYLWFRYIESADLLGDDTVIAQRIKSIHIAQVYEYVNFGMFGLGGPYG